MKKKSMEWQLIISELGGEVGEKGKEEPPGKCTITLEEMYQKGRVMTQ